MNIYLVKRTKEVNWDEYKGAVIIANSEDEARELGRTGGNSISDGWWYPADEKDSLEVTKIGVADPAFTTTEVILDSYLAG